MTEKPTYHFDLSGFLNRLSNEGFHIGIDTHILIQKVIGELPSNYELDELKRLLMPILCKSEKQETVYNSVFNYFQINQTLSTSITENVLAESHTSEDGKQKRKLKKQRLYYFSNILNTILIIICFSMLSIIICVPNLSIVKHPIPIIIILIFGLFVLISNLINSIKNQRKNNKKQVAKQSQGITPDDVHKIYADLIPVNLSDTFTQAISRLRLREPLGIQGLDIKKTVKASIDNLGFFTAKYKNYTKYTEYLILIQADNPDDHNARLYNTFFEELQYRSIPSKRYYFRTSPRICYNEQEEETNLSTVLHENSHCVLLIFSELNTFISLKSNQPYDWAKQLTRLPQRYLMLPFGSTMEAVLAQPLRNIFDAVLPATEFGFEQLENYINQGENKDSFTRYIRLRQAVPTFPIRIETEEELLQLEKLFPKENRKQLLKWIAACAVYPDFSWKMTLFLGELLSDEKTIYNTWDNLRQLARLSWYKEAYMPQSLRRIILERINKETLQWLTLVDIEYIKKGIRQVYEINKQQGFVGNAENLLTELYREPKTEAEKKTIEEKIGQSVDYVTATLVDSQLKDMLFFDLDEIIEESVEIINVEDSSTSTNLIDEKNRLQTLIFVRLSELNKELNNVLKRKGFYEQKRLQGGLSLEQEFALSEDIENLTKRTNILMREINSLREELDFLDEDKKEKNDNDVYIIYQNTLKKNTQDAFEQFIKNFPNSQFTTEAKSKLIMLRLTQTAKVQQQIFTNLSKQFQEFEKSAESLKELGRKGTLAIDTLNSEVKSHGQRLNKLQKEAQDRLSKLTDAALEELEKQRLKLEYDNLLEKLNQVEINSVSKPKQKKFGNIEDILNVHQSRTNHLLVIGIDNYNHFPKLNNAVLSVEAFADLMQRKFAFDLGNITTLFNESATRRNIFKVFKQYAKKLSNDDNLIIYFSGHGTFDKTLDEGYWIPVEAENNEIADYISNENVKQFLNVIDTHHTFLIVDSCFASFSLFEK